MSTNEYSYEKNGVTIVYSLEPSENREHPMYSFTVKGDADLTRKLLTCIKEPSVRIKSMKYHAEELFRIIASDTFIALLTPSAKARLHSDFKKRYGEHPQFKIEVSTGGPRCHHATLLNVPEPVTGTARDGQDAKAFAITHHFSMIRAENAKMYSETE